MSGYTRQASFSNGDVIDAIQHNAEYNQLQLAFQQAGGHRHDGTAGEGAYIPLIANETGDTSVSIDVTDPNDHKIIFTIDGVEVFTYSEVDGLDIDKLNVTIQSLVNVDDPLANGFFRWDPTGTNVEYSVSIDASDTTGFADVATSASLMDTVQIGTPLVNGYFRWDATLTEILYSTTIPHTDITGLITANINHRGVSLDAVLDDFDSRISDAAADAAAAAASADEAAESADEAAEAADRAENAAMLVGVPLFIEDGGSFTITDQERVDLVFLGNGTAVLPATLVQGVRYYLRVTKDTTDDKTVTVVNANFNIIGSRLTVPAGTDLCLKPGQLVILEAINTTELEII